MSLFIVVFLFSHRGYDFSVETLEFVSSPGSGVRDIADNGQKARVQNTTMLVQEISTFRVVHVEIHLNADEMRGKKNVF